MALVGKDLHKRDRVLTPEGREVEVTWKKGEVILAGGRMYMASELKKVTSDDA
jgi:hypothetical protein